MSDNVTVSVVTSSVTGLVAVVAILVNNQGFNSIEKRLDKIERTLEVIQSDLKEFYIQLTKVKAQIGMD